jgi:hypothetical protein
MKASSRPSIQIALHRCDHDRERARLGTRKWRRRWRRSRSRGDPNRRASASVIYLNRRRPSAGPAGLRTRREGSHISRKCTAAAGPRHSAACSSEFVHGGDRGVRHHGCPSARQGRSRPLASRHGEARARQHFAPVRDAATATCRARPSPSARSRFNPNLSLPASPCAGALARPGDGDR